MLPEQDAGFTLPPSTFHPARALLPQRAIRQGDTSADRAPRASGPARSAALIKKTASSVAAWLRTYILLSRAMTDDEVRALYAMSTIDSRFVGSYPPLSSLSSPLGRLRPRRAAHPSDALLRCHGDKKQRLASSRPQADALRSGNKHTPDIIAGKSTIAPLDPLCHFER